MHARMKVYTVHVWTFRFVTRYLVYGTHACSLLQEVNTLSTQVFVDFNLSFAIIRFILNRRDTSMSMWLISVLFYCSMGFYPDLNK